MIRTTYCGCPHPDAMRIKDFVGDGNKLYRSVNCIYHGDYDVEIAEYQCGHYQPDRTVGPITDRNTLDVYREQWHRENNKQE